MKTLFFDAGPIISLTLNNLLWLMDALGKKFDGKFYITPGIKKELIDKPLSSKEYEFEALQIISAIRSKYFEVIKYPELESKTQAILNIANKIYLSDGNPIQILHYGEVETFVAALKSGAEAMVVDERAFRNIIENPELEAELLRNKIHRKIEINQNALKQFRQMTGNIKLIRSAELVTIAFELGLLDSYIPNEIKNGRRKLLDALLWTVKLKGCAISSKEIDDIIRMSI